MSDKDVFDAILGDDEAFLPDGWDGESDIITDKGELNDAAFASDGELVVEDAPEENEDVAGQDTEVPTTDEDGDGSQPDQSADEETQEDVVDEPAEPEVKPSRKLKLKVNHKDEEIDIDAMSDDDLISLLQKGRAFDALKDAENKRKFREVYQEQVDAGMSEAVAQIVAQAAADGKSYSLEDEEEPVEIEDEPDTKAAPLRDFTAEVSQLRALYPDLKEIPDEVASAAAQGVPLLSAYLAYREKQSRETAAALKRENAVLKQNAAAAAKAPVKGVTGGGDAKPPKVDPFIQGFDEALDW